MARSKKSEGVTYNPSKIKRIRKHGFFRRAKNVLKKRRAKGRKKLSVSNEFGTSKMEKNKKFSRRR